MTGKPGGLDLREHKVTLAADRRAAACLGRGARDAIDELFATESPGDDLVSRCDRHCRRGRGASNTRGGGESSSPMTRSRALRVTPREPGPGCADRRDRLRHGSAVLDGTADTWIIQASAGVSCPGPRHRALSPAGSFSRRPASVSGRRGQTISHVRRHTALGAHCQSI